MAVTTTEAHDFVEYLMQSAITSDATSDDVSVDCGKYRTMRVIVDITTTANVIVEGRLSSVSNWVPLNTAVTADGAIVVDTFPYMRVASTSVSGALTVAMRGDAGR